MENQSAATAVAPGDPAPAAGPLSTGSRATRVLGAISLVGIAALVLFGLVLTEPDAELGETIRILYMHVPTVSTAYLAFVITAVASVMYLWKRTEFWDLLAASSAELGVLFFALTILNGMLWGKITWGVFWRWEPRLTTTAVLMLTYVGYLAVRQIPNDTRTRGTISAVIGIMAVINIPITHKAVDWWRGLHQEKTIFGTVDPDMKGLQLFTAYLGLVVFLVLFAWLLIHRFRVAWLAERAADVGVDAAIAERRAERAAGPGTGAPLGSLDGPGGAA
ncbi:cytochrome c biogenesis protein CcsA [Dermatobacter hominis]|uniref:cytochrome c biogenesis protein CcsA n=1 Tax=Dermatobacter hominis TaxID=2884263 RepID=UPI001D0FEDB9|nr:cytochrome c biogenesis protein CcsA [Dermatobacter hominis]UDY37286.1 cytochrome c biogenesis protein CcsA [Dermatobacter hominis]